MRSIPLLIADVALVMAGTLGAVMLRQDFAVSPERLAELAPYLGASAISATVVVLAFSLHRSIWGLTSFKDFERVAGCGLLIVCGACMLGFWANRLEGVPRSLPVLQATLVLAFMLGARAATRRFRHRRQGRGAPREAVKAAFGTSRPTVLIIGVNALTELYLKGIGEAGEGEIYVAGILGRNQRQIGRRVHSHRVLGMPEDLSKVLRELEIEGIEVDRVAVMVPTGKLTAAARAQLVAVERDRCVLVHRIADQMGLDASTRDEMPAMDDAGNAVMAFSGAELALIEGRGYWRVKRALDVVLALVLMVALAPLTLLVGLAVLIDVGSPVMFRQRRPGLRGEPFKLYKFRSMAAAYDSNGARIDDGERSSWIGRLLRRTRLDELPQLYNVLIGDMSFVGPRPLLPIDQAPEHRARLLVRPGLTGYAQVKGGREIGPDDKAAMDIWYVKNASLRLDLRIALETIPMVVIGERIDRRAIEMAWRELEATGICEGWSCSGARSVAQLRGRNPATAPDARIDAESRAA